MNQLNGLLATSATGLPPSTGPGLGRPPELWEAPQWPFLASLCPAAPGAPPFFSGALRFH